MLLGRITLAIMPATSACVGGPKSSFQEGGRGPVRFLLEVVRSVFVGARVRNAIRLLMGLF